MFIWEGREVMLCLICRKAKLSSQEKSLGIEDDEICDVCEPCRADAALGRAVRKIPDMAKLWHAEVRWYLHPGDAPCLPLGTGSTPEAALVAAGLMEGEGK